MKRSAVDKNDTSPSFGLNWEVEKTEEFSALPRDKQARILRTAHEASGKEKKDILLHDIFVQG